jgi:hypothetical protein
VKSDDVIFGIMVVGITLGIGGLCFTLTNLDSVRSELEREREKTHELSHRLAQKNGFLFEDNQDIRAALCRFESRSDVELCGGLLHERPITYRCDADDCRFDCGGGK